MIPVLARRFLLSRKSNGFLSLIAWVSVFGMLLGVMALTVVTSVINGFEGELKRGVTSMNGDVIFYTRGGSIPDPKKMESQILSTVNGIEAVSSSFVVQLMVSGSGGVAGAALEGVEKDRVGLVTEIPKRIISGTLPQNKTDVVLGSSLAEKINAKVGDEIRIIVPFVKEKKGGEFSADPKIFKVKVSGIVKVGLYQYDSKYLFTHIETVQDFLKQKDRVTTFKLKLSKNLDAREVALKLSDAFGYPFRAKSWSQLNQNLLYAIYLEKIVIAIIMTVIVLVAAFNVISTLMMMIHDKSKEIAILKAMGLRSRQAFGLFCFIGTGIGLVGTALGILVGLGLNLILEKTRFIDLPSDVYYIGYLPVVVRWEEVFLIAFCSLLIVVIATLYPGFQVARRNPLDGLRYE